MSDHLGTWTAEPTSDVAFRLDLWDTYRTSALGKSILRYELTIVEGSGERSREPVTFEGEDFSPSPLHAIDSDATVAALLSFFAYDGETINRRERDDDNADGRTYTERQCEALAANYEALSLWGYELDPDA